MTTEVGDGWKYYEGASKYPGLCAICGLNVEKDVFYKGKTKMHRECFSNWTVKGRPELAVTSPAADDSKTLGSAPSSDSPRTDGIAYQLTTKDLLEALEQIGAEISEVSRAIKEQTAWLLSNAVKTNEVK